MRYRKLGRTNLAVSEISYGAWGIGGKQWLGGGNDESVQALRRAIDLGLNFIDTALAYGDGHSERLVGQVVKESGAPVLLATKIPPKNRIWPAQPGIGIQDVFPYDYIIQSTEESLRNLGVDCIDLQQYHVWNPEWLASEEWQRGIEDLKRAGKVRYMGISINDHQPDSALSIIATGKIDTVQVINNIFDPTPAINLYPLCLKHNIGVLARCPLDEGSLTGSISADTQFEPGEFRAMYFRDDRKQQVVAHVDALTADLAMHDLPGTLAQTALRWVLSQEAVSCTIPGMRRVKTVESSLAVPDMGRLDDAVLALLAKHAWGKNFYQ